MTAAATRTNSTLSPWQRWGWVVAAFWLVFLAYPVIETFQADSSTPAKGLVLALIAAYAVTYLLGWSVWRDHALTVWFAMLLLAVGTVPVIGIEAIGLTPYLGAFSALMVPAPWWKWATAFSALLPVLSLIGGDFPAFFFLMAWPLIGFFTAMRGLEVERAGAAEEARASWPGGRTPTGWHATYTMCWSLPDGSSIRPGASSASSRSIRPRAREGLESPIQETAAKRSGGPSSVRGLAHQPRPSCRRPPMLADTIRKKKAGKSPPIRESSGARALNTVVGFHHGAGTISAENAPR